MTAAVTYRALLAAQSDEEFTAAVATIAALSRADRDDIDAVALLVGNERLLVDLADGTRDDIGARFAAPF